MLQAVPKSWWSWDFALMEGEQPVGDIHLSRWSERGRLSIEQASYDVYREGWMRGVFVLAAGGRVAARAEKASAFHRSFDIDHEGRRYTLRAASAFGRAFVLLQGTRVLGSVSPAGFFSRRARVSLPAELPLPLRAFVVWLVLLLWRRSANSAAAGAGAGAP